MIIFLLILNLDALEARSFRIRPKIDCRKNRVSQVKRYIKYQRKHVTLTHVDIYEQLLLY